MNGKCSRSESRVWKALRSALRADNRIHIVLTVVVTFLFPLGEGFLSKVVTTELAAKVGWSPSSITLCVLALLHLVLGIIITIRNVSVAPDLLAEAVDAQDCCTCLRTELNRRLEAYRMVREAFDSLNTESCSMGNICAGGFEGHLAPIMMKITQDIHTVLGVKGALFSVEVYFEEDYVPHLNKGPTKPTPECNICLEYFYSPAIPRAKAEQFSARYLLAPAMIQQVAKQQTVNEDRSVFFDNKSGQLHKNVYFNRYAAHPICESCSGNVVGLLVLTSNQKDAFADDVIETLAFISSLLSRYVYAYRECIFAKKQAITAQQRVQHMAAQRASIPAPKPGTPPQSAPKPIAQIQPALVPTPPAPMTIVSNPPPVRPAS